MLVLSVKLHVSVQKESATPGRKRGIVDADFRPKDNKQAHFLGQPLRLQRGPFASRWWAIGGLPPVLVWSLATVVRYPRASFRKPYPCELKLYYNSSVMSTCEYPLLSSPNYMLYYLTM